jgi:hypothetical protein
VKRLLVTLSALALLAPATAGAQPRLSYGRAKAAVQVKANKIAGRPTRVTTMIRVDATTYGASAEWEQVNPHGCPGCGYDPATGTFFDEPRTESCSVHVHARLLSSGRIRVSLEDSLCF